MIFGIGTDLVDMRRIEKTYNRFGDAFVRRILSPPEQLYFSTLPSISRSLLLAKRFAAKEATVKALGTGISKPISWHDIEVKHGIGARPQLCLSVNALTFLHVQIGREVYIQLDLSLSDEYPYVQAFVIVSYE